MNGLAVVFHADRQPIGRELLVDMAETLRVRGPDAQSFWADDEGIGLVQSHFKTTDNDEPATQPVTFDNATWIVADARMDARGEFIDRLRGLGRNLAPTVSDTELILHAWHIWGTSCVDHLLGDFAFVVVDTCKRRVFAARDPLGVRPLFYANNGRALIVSNLIDCVRLHPLVGDKLNDSWVCDFLLFGWNTDVTATVFQDIRRLPPGHWMEWTTSGTRVERYWSPPVVDELWLRRPEEYVERFNEVFETAVADRMRCQRLAIAMSGGLDSTTIAATGVNLARRKWPNTTFHSVTAAWDPTLPNDREREYATEAATHLGIDSQIIECSELPFFDGAWDAPETQMPEPVERTGLTSFSIVRAASQHARVLLYGEGGDTALRFPYFYFQHLLTQRRYFRWLADAWRHWKHLRRVPQIGLRSAIRSVVNPRTSSQNLSPEFPAWIATDLVQEWDLWGRWKKFWLLEPGDTLLGYSGAAEITGFRFPDELNFFDAMGMHGPIEYRLPWLDLRVLKFCWLVPPVPLRVGKRLARLAMHKLLPQRVVERRKTGLAGSPFLANRKRLTLTWNECVARTPEISRYVHGDPLPGVFDANVRLPNLWLHLRPLEFYSWLRHRRPFLKAGRTAERKTSV